MYEWIAFGIHVVITLTLVFFMLYAFYKLDVTRTNLEKQIVDLQRKFARLVEAINAVNYSEYKLDQAQQQKIDEIAKKV